jgi:hypothetical protein
MEILSRYRYAWKKRNASVLQQFECVQRMYGTFKKNSPCAQLRKRKRKRKRKR